MCICYSLCMLHTSSILYFCCPKILKIFKYIPDLQFNSNTFMSSFNNDSIGL